MKKASRTRPFSWRQAAMASGNAKPPLFHLPAAGRLGGGRRCRLLMTHVPQLQRLLALGHVVARDRQRGVLLGELVLEDHQVLPAEGGFRGGEVEFPHAAAALV